MFFRALESWRGIAALCVALFHFAGFFWPADFGSFVIDAYLFVDFFFVLSGLVIGSAYAEKLTRPEEGWRFVLRRFGRLYPLHIATFFAVLAWQLRHGGHPNLDLLTDQGLNPILSNLLLIHALGVNSSLSFNFPSWSISAEFWTCMVFLLVMRFGGRLGPLAGAALIAGSMLLVLGLFHTGSDATFDYGFPRAIAGFFTGWLTFHLFTRLGTRAPGGTVPEIAVLAIVIAFVTLAGKPTGLDTPQPLAAVLRLVLAPFVFAPAVLVFASESGAVSALLRLPPFRFLGRISYSIYMVHALVLILMPTGLAILSRLTGADWTQHALGEEAAAGYWPRLLFVLACAFAATIALATLTYAVIEQPARRFFNRRASARPLAAATLRQPAAAE